MMHSSMARWSSVRDQHVAEGTHNGSPCSPYTMTVAHGRPAQALGYVLAKDDLG